MKRTRTVGDTVLQCLDGKGHGRLGAASAGKDCRTNRFHASVILGWALVCLFLFYAGCSPEVYVVSPPDGDSVLCGCSEACFFEVKGTISRPLQGSEEVYVAIRPIDAAAPRYFIQFGAETIDKTIWTVRSQIGSAQFPPQDGQTFEVWSLVIDTAVAGLPGVDPLSALSEATIPGLVAVSEAHTLSVACNAAPTAQSQSISISPNAPTAITLSASDADGPEMLTYSIISQPAHGTLETNGQGGTSDGYHVTYTPAEGYTGSDSFTFKANDGQKDSNVATITITVARHDETILDALTKHTYWHLYSPFRTVAGGFVLEDQIRQELQMLYDCGARGLVTYEMMNGAQIAPRLAKEIGYRWVIAGIYWWTNGVVNGQTQSTLQDEKDAIESNIEYIDAIVIGNEGLLDSSEWNQPRYSFDDLTRELAAMKAKHPDKPVTTAEGATVYTLYTQLVSDAELTDFIFPNIHPWWGGFRVPTEGADNLVDTLNTEPFSNRGSLPIVMHEAWWPSETEGQTEDAQVEFFQTLLEAGVRFCRGETIDQPWKGGPEGSVGPHWGLWHSDETSETYLPKEIVNMVCNAQ